MSQQQASRRDFLKVLGVTAGAPLIGTSAFAAFQEHPKVHELNASQLDFMKRYGNWMDEFLQTHRGRKANPDSAELRNKMKELTEQAIVFKPELAAHMKDETFALIFNITVERMGQEI